MLLSDCVVQIESVAVSSDARFSQLDLNRSGNLVQCHVPALPDKDTIVVFGGVFCNLDGTPTSEQDSVSKAYTNNLKAIIAQQLIPSVDKTRRYASYEILIRTTALGNIIATGESMRLNSEIQMNKAMGMILMDDSFRV